ncbi:NADH-quinone oxidoreductase subunit H [Oxobacter pfennigii]|uniref:NADH-quinone oxidoreductase subunit H n=1 Tax=Oxobacter pfennigii TaxID=36849 RepID=A0A0P8Z1W2_9CLOT|nr:NADH-quinone oxidoreductase subunit NuoH [Oxobacter pfennigii]KPU46099.1 NADH-quinone oxidoreductase subunit H [Oxobacter pfennigii]
MNILNDIFTKGSAKVRDILIYLGFNGLITDFLMSVIYFVAVAAVVTFNIIFILWIDRRGSGFFQERVGPNRVGPFGLLQSLNDAVKLIGKESIIPEAVDKYVYKLAPIFIFTITIMLYAVLPYGKDMSAVNINVGILYFTAISSMSSIVILMAGWGSNNKYSLIGGMRTIAQIISYEIPFCFSMLGIVMLAGTLNLNEIVASQQKVWYILYQPVAFLVFIISALAELNKSPFDMMEAEQEIVAGYHTEYSGMRFALFFMAEYANLFVMAGLGVTLFFGGWQGPFLPSWLWFMVKTYMMIFFILWLRWSLPRARIDKMMQFNWKFLIPVSMANVFMTGVGLKIIQFIK